MYICFKCYHDSFAKRLGENFNKKSLMESVTICPQNLSQAQNTKTHTPKPQPNNQKVHRRITLFLLNAKKTP